jgi:7-cyano-7-deazaguanine synthase in queuosine biosynthesis
MRVTRFVGPDGCTDTAYVASLTTAGATIDTLSAERNVTVRFRCDDHPLRIDLADDLRDLVDLAVSVYVGDELEDRGNAPDGWTREFSYTIPVYSPSLWQQGETVLRRTLSFLAGDQFEFAWPQRTELPASRRSRTVLPEGFDTVCLFSGGIDSLLGAHQLLSEGRKVLLVGHQAEGVTARAQKELAGQLQVMFPGAASLIQCRVARSKNDVQSFPLPGKVEDTHRPRSFLFLTLAVAVARSAGISEVYMPENGLIAINPPLQKNRLGTLSTRTAHPIYVSGVLEFLNTTGLFMGGIRNPFLYQSKTDMLRALAPALIDPVLRSVSCSRPSRYQDQGVRHCGYCVPCVYRRAAMMACGLDHANEYAFDFLEDLPAMTPHTQADVRAVAAFAHRVLRASEVELQLLVLSHGYFSPDVGGRIGPTPATDHAPWAQMLRRWAKDFVAEVEPRSSPAVREMLALPTVVTRNPNL